MGDVADGDEDWSDCDYGRGVWRDLASGATLERTRLCRCGLEFADVAEFERLFELSWSIGATFHERDRHRTTQEVIFCA